MHHVRMQGNHDLMGSAVVSVRRIIAGERGSIYPPRSLRQSTNHQARLVQASNPHVCLCVIGEPIELIEEKKKGRMGYKNSGHVVPLRPAVTREPSLSDYMKGGCRINLLVGIDFTGPCECWSLCMSRTRTLDRPTGP